jgi:ketosteroid isomerase-like protein
MEEITVEGFERWLASYGAAWQDGDARAVVKLFADDAEYFENPFGDPLRGTDAIGRYWSEGAGESQKDVRFTHNVVTVVNNIGLAQWHATFVRVPSGKHVELDGFLMAGFNHAGQCSVFREWWHRREGRTIEAA